MGFGKIARLAVSASAAVALLAGTPVNASASAIDWSTARFDVTRVKLVKGGRAAKVRFTVICKVGGTFSVNVDVRQDSDGTAPLDAFYTTTHPVKRDCTGKVQRFKVLVEPEPLGLYAPKDGRLIKGNPTVEVIWGVYGDQPFAQEDNEPLL